jgi:acyl carrier protein
MSEEATVKEQILQFILETAQSKGVAEVGDEDSLTKSGVIDSLGVFRLVQFLEDTFSFTIENDEMIPDNFTTIAQLERFVGKKLAGNGSAG